MSNLYYETNSGKISVHMDGVLRAVPNTEVFGRLFGGPINIGIMNQYTGTAPLPEGDALSVSARLVRANDGAAVYLLDIQGGAVVRRHITSAAEFEGMGLSWGQISVEDSDTVQTIPMGRPCLTAASDPNRKECTFLVYNPIYQSGDGKAYTFTITAADGGILYHNKSKTNAGVDTYYGTSWGREVVLLPPGDGYTVSLKINDGANEYEWSGPYAVRADVVPQNLKILHNFYKRSN